MPPSHVLIVDDEAIVRAEVAEMLGHAGYHTYEAASVSEALAILEASGGAMQMLFTDVKLSGTRNGFDLAKECAQRWPHISIVVASGEIAPTPETSTKGTVFISKPFNPTVVAQRLQELASVRRD